MAKLTSDQLLENRASSIIPHYRIRQMKLEDVEEVLEIWALNDLHEGTDTIKSFMFQDPEGFVVAVEIGDHQSLSIDNTDKEEILKLSKHQFLDENDNDDRSQTTSKSNNNSKILKLQEKKILGMCAGLFVHPTIAFIGLYGVRPEYHGRGIGLSMWKQMMEHVGSLNAALYAVPEHLTTYRDRAGFQYRDDRLLFIYESSDTDSLNIDVLVQSIQGIKLARITTELFNRVIDYDSSVHGYCRKKLLPHVFTEEKTAAFAALDIDNNDVRGYGCIRTNNIGKAMIGPLYAENDAIAELLMRYLFRTLSKAFEKGLLYMTLDSNPGGERIAEKLGLKKHEELPRFFRTEPYLNVEWNSVYCIHSPNFSLL